MTMTLTLMAKQRGRLRLQRRKLGATKFNQGLEASFGAEAVLVAEVLPPGVEEVLEGESTRPRIRDLSKTGPPSQGKAPILPKRNVTTVTRRGIRPRVVLSLKNQESENNYGYCL